MRDKFTELIEQGVAPAHYNSIMGEVPQLDYLCIMYNNLYSMVSDTHMSPDPYNPGSYIITGHMINTPQWDRFLTAGFWGGYQMKYNEYWCPADMFYKNSLIGNKSICNGDVVYMLTPMSTQDVVGVEDAPTSYTTSESRIPKPLIELTTNGDINVIKECYSGNIYEIADKFNKSLYIRGNEWIVSEGKLIGHIGNKTIIL